MSAYNRRSMRAAGYAVKSSTKQPEYRAIAITLALSSLCLLGSTSCMPGNKSTPLTITTTSLPNGMVNHPYSASIAGAGGVGPYAFSVTPAPPANLSFDSFTGAITGTPAAAGTTSLTFTLRDSSPGSAQTVQKTLTLTIAPAAGPLAITTTSLPDGNVGGAYNQTMQATGGTAPLTWSVATGVLPQNLDLNATGVISGTPTAAGTSSFTLRVADAAGQEATQALSITINPASPPAITTLSLPGGTVGFPYNEVLNAAGGTGTLVWSLAAGSLPTNLMLSPTGTISGTPTVGGTSNFNVKVMDALAQSDTQSLSITVSVALAITTTSPLPDAEVGKSYNKTLQRSGGVSPFVWSVIPALPTGLNLEASTGKISGIPAVGTDGSYMLTFTLQDSSTPVPQTAIKPLSLKIKP